MEWQKLSKQISRVMRLTFAFIWPLVLRLINIRLSFFAAYLHVYFRLYYVILHSTFGRLTFFVPFFYLFFYSWLTSI